MPLTVAILLIVFGAFILVVALSAPERLQIRFRGIDLSIQNPFRSEHNQYRYRAAGIIVGLALIAGGGYGSVLQTSEPPAISSAPTTSTPTPQPTVPPGGGTAVTPRPPIGSDPDFETAIQLQPGSVQSGTLESENAVLYQFDVSPGGGILSIDVTCTPAGLLKVTLYNPETMPLPRAIQQPTPTCNYEHYLLIGESKSGEYYLTVKPDPLSVGIGYDIELRLEAQTMSPVHRPASSK